MTTQDATLDVLGPVDYVVVEFRAGKAFEPRRQGSDGRLQGHAA
jgi:hypothetical protein